MMAHRGRVSERTDSVSSERSQKECVVELRMHKPAVDVPLGIRFVDPLEADSPALTTDYGGVRTIVEQTATGSISATVLHPGDEILSIDGNPVHGPSNAAATLRATHGYIRVSVLKGAFPVADLISYEGKSESSDESAGATDVRRTDDSGYDDERLATGEMRRMSCRSATGSPGHAAFQSPFKLDLPTQMQHTSLAVTGIKGHVRLHESGSSFRVLRKKTKMDRKLSQNDPDGSLTARVRRLGAIFSPRA